MSSSVHVLFDHETEIRFDGVGPGWAVLENVLPLPEVKIEVTGKTVGHGGWISTEDALAAWAPNRRVSRAAAVLRFAHHVGVFAAFVAAGLAILALAGALAGCSTTEERHDHLIRAGRILLRHSTPEAGWESRRDTWLAASEIEAPDAAPVESGK